MLIPRGTSFLVRCMRHDATVEGQLKMKHPTSEATAVWGFDFEDMHCPVGVKVINNCKLAWEVRA